MKLKKIPISSKVKIIAHVLAIITILFILPFSLHADTNDLQQTRRMITGTVVDSKGETLPGVIVEVAGRQGGVITDVDGKYQIEAATGEALRFKLLGMKMQTVSITASSVLNIKMENDVEQLADVVVTAFAKQKRESVVSAIETIDPRELRIPTSNLTSALAGRLAGVISYQTSGEPGADNAQFFVRGVGSFGYAKDPLILMDGFEVSKDDLARIDPDNIASFSVLKDATSAALYGSKGANGVIMVTTKRGQTGAPRVAVRVEGRLSEPTKILKTVDGLTYMNLYNEAQFNDNPLLPPYYSAQKIENTMNNLNPYAYPNLNWYDEMFKSNAFNQHYNLNITGGGSVVNYYLAASYDKENGLLRNNNMNNFKNNIDINRFNLLTNITINLTASTKLDFNMNSIFENYTGQLDNASDVFGGVINSNPVEFPTYYQPDSANVYTRHTLFGTDATGSRRNPFANMVRGYKDGSNARITSQFSIDQKLDAITEGLLARAKVSIRSYTSTESKRSYDPYLYAIKKYDEFTDTYTLQEVHRGSDALGNPDIQRASEFRLYFEGGLTYNRRINDMHDIMALLIYTQEENKNSNSRDQATIQRTLPHRLQGMRGRINYGYGDRYLAELSLTYTGSEKFNKDHRWGLFPAMGLGYIISNESFWEPLMSTIPMLKFKYSLGQVGNDQIADANNRFFFLSDIAINMGGNDGYRWGKDYNSNYGRFSINRYANPLITWEIAVKQNFGIETDLLKDRGLKFILEYFTENRKQIYQERQNLPNTMGLTSGVFGNVGEVSSAGWDGSIDYNHNFNKDLWMTGRLNFTYAHNKIVQNEEPVYKYPYLSKIGWPIDTWQGYVAERLFIDQADIDNSPAQQLGSIVRPGDIKYKDINGDGVINDNDKMHIGYPTVPEITYGFGLSAGYKNLDLSFFMQGQDRVSFFIDSRGEGPSDDHYQGITPFANGRNLLQIIADDHWSPNNPVSHAFWPRLSASRNSNNEQTSNWWLRSGRLLRMKNAELGYTIPKKTFGKLPVAMARVYVSCTNLFNITNFKLWDPEIGRSGFNYPLQRVYNVGLNLNF